MTHVNTNNPGKGRFETIKLNFLYYEQLMDLTQNEVETLNRFAHREEFSIHLAEAQKLFKEEFVNSQDCLKHRQQIGLRIADAVQKQHPEYSRGLSVASALMVMDVAELCEALSYEEGQ